MLVKVTSIAVVILALVTQFGRLLEFALNAVHNFHRFVALEPPFAVNDLVAIVAKTLFSLYVIPGTANFAAVLARALEEPIVIGHLYRVGNVKFAEKDWFAPDSHARE